MHGLIFRGNLHSQENRKGVYYICKSTIRTRNNMSRPKRWQVLEEKDGVWTIQLASWKYFHDYITQEMLNYSHYVWRGDRLDDRPLLLSFDRDHPSLTKAQIEERLKAHLDQFKLATRGRRGLNPSRLDTDNDWWALGQHHGLKTPLLDWTRSPFVALFFAFEKLKKPQTPNRAIYAVNPGSCTKFTKTIRAAHKGKLRPDIVEFFTPLQDENFRLVNQSGLFSRCTAGKTLDEWIQERYPGYGSGVLIKILIPNRYRLDCLRTLNKMNINSLTLFPDLYGASGFANMVESIGNYY